MKIRLIEYFILGVFLSACTIPFSSRAYVAVQISTPANVDTIPTLILDPILMPWTPSRSMNSLTEIPSKPRNTSINSPSPTYTPSPSLVPINTSTSTVTGSPTLSLTLSTTGAITRTQTSTSTKTKTPTPSQTLIISPGVPTNTITPSATRTSSRTPTSTFTSTKTIQSTTLPPPTLTYTRTFTLIPSTATLNRTSTITRTSTFSFQPTTPPPPTLTFTRTFTNPLPSATFTRTNTSVPPTVTFTRTPTNTFTSTLILPTVLPPTLTLILTPTSPPPTSTTFSCNPSSNGGYESQVLALINNERAMTGAAPLSVQAQLGNAARGHSQDMGCNGFFSHTGSDGSSPATRVSRQGYSWSAVAENIAAGYGDPSSVVSGWMGSQGHKDNILNPIYTEIGIGYIYVSGSPYGSYWTANFARP
jgi:uncharacterized protein YkwD